MSDKGSIPATTPRATMRLQLHKGFTFDDAAQLAPYIARLGISHLYTSPILTARSGSMHGYDVVDPTRVNPELGGEAAFRRLVAALRAEGLGLIVDIVPNHMAVGLQNAWWQDVLRHGRSSRYADFFDIDWHPDNPLLDGKILVPVLGRQYGEVLKSGEITLARGDADWEARYFDNVFPIAPEDHPEIEAASPSAYDTGTEDGRARLHRLLERQHYRLAWWRTAADEINWRRFFDINELAGIRAEDPDAFEATHALLFRFYAEGLIDGMRVDHVDGLSDPGGYCRRLRARLRELEPRRPGDAPAGPAYLVVEKILGASEHLATDWEIDGTTGYDFMNEVSAVQHDPAAASTLGELWTSLSARPVDFAQEELLARREMIEHSFTAPLEATVGALHRVALMRLETRDLSRPALGRALTELLVHFPVYRSYATAAAEPEADAEMFAKALAGCPPGSGRAVVETIIGWLRRPIDPAKRIAATRFQQLSAPIAAKSVEDTAFYRYGRLISRNDVGFDAAVLGITPASFHKRMAERRRHFPDAMLATGTHDHKRGEDVRARLAVISEIPEEWGETLRRWQAMNADHRIGDAPSAGDEVMLYETIIGAWPITLDSGDGQGVTAFRDRLARWQEKALHEAKLRTSWTEPNAGYEEAARDFLDGILAEGSPFPDDAARFVARIAASGAVNGLAQTLLKLAAPGVPDFYQGSEFWDQSLVDPDNRRPVDFRRRQEALEAGSKPAELMLDWRDGRVKQAVMARVLEARRRLPDLFARGDYLPLQVDGAQAAHVLGFCRRMDGAALVCVVPRLPLALMADGGILIPPSSWHDTTLRLPAGLPPLADVLTGMTLRAERVRLGDLLAAFPMALLIGDGA